MTDYLCGCVGCRALEELFRGAKPEIRRKFETPERLRDALDAIDYFGLQDIARYVRCTGEKQR